MATRLTEQFCAVLVAPRRTQEALERRHVRVEQTKYIGKESNSLEEVESGLIHSEQSVYTLYEDRRRDEWQWKILPALKKATFRETSLQFLGNRSNWL